MSQSYTIEAVRKLKAALALRPPVSPYPDNPGYQDQTVAMAHDLVGDAYLELGRTDEACRHWRKAMQFDPVPRLAALPAGRRPKVRRG